MLRKDGYPYEYMDVGESLINHHWLKKTIYSNFNMEHITDADYIHAKNVQINKFRWILQIVL